QFERGMTSIAIDSLQKITKILDMDMNSFFNVPKKSSRDEEPVIRSYDRQIGSVNTKYVQFYLARNLEEARFLPRIYELWPSSDNDHVKTYVHEGVEFIYVLEGILTLHYKNKVYEMYPEDSAYLDSKVPHNWENSTNKKVRILVINYPNPFIQHNANTRIDEHGK
ncbi:MAG: cupin domain-containing protein, partial [Peptostreptococcaceae bacterium]|nr:cupin domain-containing protein [Peptostreptococcaceae bacterium]